MFRRTVASSLVAALLLAGCGTVPSAVPTAARTAKTVAAANVTHNTPVASVVANNAATAVETVTEAAVGSAKAPSITVTSTPVAVLPVALAPVATVLPEAPVSPATLVAPTASGPIGSLRIAAELAMTDEELAKDAESQGYSLQSTAAGDSAIGTPFSESGIVRETTTGFALETSTGWFTKEYTKYTLDGSAEIKAELVDRINKKSKIKGVQDIGGVVKVTSVGSAIDLGILTNWLTKGKISGTITDAASKRPLLDVKISVKSADGYLFSATTDDEGYFAVKTLVAGDYTVSMSKTGYTSIGTGAAAPAIVKKRTNLKFIGELAPVVAAAE